jgi:dihydrodipicolinate synthase/N-acetylneuraminate lyase
MRIIGQEYHELTGVIPILPTPFSANGEIDERAFRKVIDRAVADGVQGLAMFGFASEYAKLADVEKARLIRILVEQTAKRVPVIVSITHHSLEVARKEAAEAVGIGADALMIMPPFFMSPSSEAVQNHIAVIAGETAVPVIIQYAPIQTGSSLTAEILYALHQKYPNLAYVKVDLIPSGPMISKVRSLSGDSLKAMVGYMGLHLPQDFERGAVAVMPTISLARAFIELFGLLESDPEGGRRLHERLLPLLVFMMQSVEVLVVVEKLLLERQGLLASSYCRSPTLTLDAIQIAEIDRFCLGLKEFLP